MLPQKHTTYMAIYVKTEENNSMVEANAYACAATWFPVSLCYAGTRFPISFCYAATWFPISLCYAGTRHPISLCYAGT